jgi:NADH dehydrogenase
MKILIIGGTGFVGKYVVQQALTAGYSVRLLVHTRSSEINNPMLEVVTGDILDKPSLSEAMRGCDIVINLVGIIKEKPPTVTFEKMHFHGTQNIVDTMTSVGVTRYLHMSALGTSHNAISKYFQTKWLAEEYIRVSNLDFTIIRPSIIWSEESDFIRQLEDLIKLPVITPVIGNGKNEFQPVHVHDVASCFIASIERPETYKRIFEIGGPDVVTFKELLQYLVTRKRQGSNRIFIPVPSLFVAIVATLAEKTRIPFAITPDQLKMLKLDNKTEDKELFNILSLNPIKVIQ